MLRIPLAIVLLVQPCISALEERPTVQLGNIRQVPKIDWSTRKKNFASSMAWIGEPTIILNSQFAKESKAAKTWTPEYLAKHVPRGKLQSVKRYPVQEGTPLFASGMPMAGIPEFMQLYKPHYSRHDLTVDQFFDHMGIDFKGTRQSSCSADPTINCDEDDEIDASVLAVDLETDNPRLSYSANLNEWGPTLMADVDMDTLIPLAKETYDGPAIEVRPYVWMGQQNVVTPCHYDYFDNFFFMIEGTKHFLLLPPSAHVDLDLHPALHPAHRSSQLTFPLFSTANASAHSVVGGVDGWEVVLKPGEILYIPAFYFHHVTTLTPFALATNVWSEIETARHHASALQVALPFVAELAESEQSDFFDDEFKDSKAQIMRAYLSLIFEDLHIGENDTRVQVVASMHHLTTAQAFIKYHLLDRRYRWYGSIGVHTDESSDTGRWPRFCNDPHFISSFVSSDGGFGVHMLQATVKEVESILLEIDGTETQTRARSTIMVVTWIERTLHEAFGAKYVPQFLHDFVMC
eukprot:m.70401 g.70401  ORF g.70401 m.70401 type:complete len:519 (+) comp24219_c0_seq3:254-1810(+)